MIAGAVYSFAFALTNFLWAFAVSKDYWLALDRSFFQASAVMWFAWNLS